MTVKTQIAHLNSIIERADYHKLSQEQKSALLYIEKLLTGSFINRVPKPAPNYPLKVKKYTIQRVLDLPLPSIILYIMQENGEPVCYRSIKEFLSGLNVITDNKRAILGTAFKHLVNNKLAINSEYGIYELTEKGKNKLV